MVSCHRILLQESGKLQQGNRRKLAYLDLRSDHRYFHKRFGHRPLSRTRKRRLKVFAERKCFFFSKKEQCMWASISPTRIHSHTLHSTRAYITFSPLWLRYLWFWDDFIAFPRQSILALPPERIRKLSKKRGKMRLECLFPVSQNFADVSESLTRHLHLNNSARSYS